MKTMKKTVSLLICAVMVATTVFGAGLASLLKAEAADITIGGITQKRVVDNYEATYASYAEKYFSGKDTNGPTNFVIPGLASTDDYTPQGLTYYAAKEWILISAYDASGKGRNSVIYALDAKTTKFVALFKLLNSDGSANTSHGGGIAASKYNFYYADSASNISYVPLSDLDVLDNTVKEVRLVDSIDLSGELNGASTSYCCYDDGVLWTGNFFYNSTDYDYYTKANPSYNSMVLGYKLHGNNSAEEWYYLSTGYNRIILNSTSSQTVTSGAATMTYTASTKDGAKYNIKGTVSATDSVGEIIATFANFTLVEGKNYTIEFYSNQRNTDMYMFAPTGAHMNVNQVAYVGQEADGRHHWKMNFTAGLAVPGADTSWPSTQSTDGSFTGTYSVRFDLDGITAGERNFEITDISITETTQNPVFTPNEKYIGIDTAGNPTYCIALNNDLDKVQYAMVDNGKIYMSRSWGRKASGNYIRELVVGDFDLNVPGDDILTVNGRQRQGQVVENTDVTKFGGKQGAANENKMFYMSEALCVIDDYLYMFAESAAWNYRGKDSSNVCPEPIDVIWKIDQHAIMGIERDTDETEAESYQKINNISEITADDEYLIVYESSVKDPVTGNNILYALDSYGGYGDNKLPKQDSGTQANTGDSMGVIGYKISRYSVDGDKLYISTKDDSRKSIRWNITGAGTSSMRIANRDFYYATNKNFYMGSRLFAMTTEARTNLDKIKLEGSNGNFKIYYQGANNNKYYLWCNDGSDQSIIDTYSTYYSTNNSSTKKNYEGLTEQAGTFHSDANMLSDSSNTGNLTGAAVSESLQTMHIYKRIKNPYLSTEYSRIYTDLNAELQADGTYTVNLETYSVNKNQQKKIDTQRPTDYIIVMDASNSGSNSDTSGRERWGWSNTLSIGAIISDVGDPGSANVTSHYQHSDNSDIFYRTPDGKYHVIYGAVRTTTRSKNWIGTLTIQQYYWLYYIGDDNLRYVLHTDGTVSAGISETQFNSNVDNAVGYSAGSSKRNEGDRDDTKCYTGLHFGDATVTNLNRFFAAQDTAMAIANGIMAESQKSGLDNRVALVQYGSGSSNTGTDNCYFYTTDGSKVPYGSATASSYANAFFSANNNYAVPNFIDRMTISTNNDYTYAGIGFEMAKGIIDNSSADYLSTSGRNLCVIVVNDGGLGKNSTAAIDMANAAVSNAYKVKEAGAYVYSIKLGGHTISGFNPDQYLEAISSDYVYAKGYSERGERNTRETEYKIDVSSAADVAYNANSYAKTVLSDSFVDSQNAMIAINTGSVIREKLTDAFVVPGDAVVTARLAPSSVDGLDRISFGTPVPASGVNTSYDRETKTITATGYDYSTNYISKDHNGNKLIVSITGVLPNVDNTNFSNTSISDYNSTAVYENQQDMESDNAIKYFPTEKIDIPEYNYVLDYGITACDNSIDGTPLSVDLTPQKQTGYRNDYSTDDIDVGISNGDITCAINPGADGDAQTSKGYVLMKNSEGGYEWIRVNVIPASNVLYEESELSFDKSGAVSWVKDGATANSSQQISKTVYGGFDPAYYNTNQYSNGSALTATVKSTNKKSDKATFKFTGTGFDLVSACGPDTGVEVITVKQGTEIKKVFIIDTYYNDSTYGTLYQVPIASYSDAYGTYTVETTAAYLSFAGALHQGTVQTASIDGTDIEASSAQLDAATASELLAQIGMEELAGEDIEVIWMDDNSIFNGGTGAQGSTLSTQAAGDSDISLVSYIDGFRIYNPLKDEQAAKYYPASEQGAEYYNIIGSLTSGNGNISGDANNWLAYVEGSNGKFGFGEYNSNGGPKNEVYLDESADNGLVFSFKVNRSKINQAKAMISVRAASGNPTLQILGQTVSLVSSTEMYIDISKFIGEKINDSSVVTTDGDDYVITVSVKNLGGGLLAVDNLKLVNCNTTGLSTLSIEQVNELMSMTPSNYSLDGVIGMGGRAPSVTNTGADPDLDPEGELNPEPEQPNAIDAVLNRIVTFLQNAFEFVKTAFIKFIGIFDLLKF